MILEQGTFEIFKESEAIVLAYGKESGYKTTDIAELTALYRREMTEKLANVGVKVAPTISIGRLAQFIDLVNVGQDHRCTKLVKWLIPKREQAETFIFMADTLAEATGALKCWVFSQDFEAIVSNTAWRKIAAILWQQN